MLHDLYHALAWTWGGDGQGGANSTGYLLFSGPVADLAMLSIFAVIYKKHVCRHKGCWRITRAINPYCHFHMPMHSDG